LVLTSTAAPQCAFTTNAIHIDRGKEEVLVKDVDTASTRSHPASNGLMIVGAVAHSDEGSHEMGQETIAVEVPLLKGAAAVVVSE
jgi:hypothetical protein